MGYEAGRTGRNSRGVQSYFIHCAGSSGLGAAAAAGPAHTSLHIDTVGHHSITNSYVSAVYAGLAGHDRGDIEGGVCPTDYPPIGPVAGICRLPEAAIGPSVTMHYITAEGNEGSPQPGFFSGWLSRIYDLLFVLCDSNSPEFGIPGLSRPSDVGCGRLDSRSSLIGRLTNSKRFIGRRFDEMDRFQPKAFDVLPSAATQDAFRMDRESPRVWESYGRNIYGQCVLMARSLIEVGTRVVCISWTPDVNVTWDTHWL